MTPREEEEALESMLHEPLPYIDDAGFTERVVARLPPRKRTIAWLRSVIVLCFSVLAGLLLLLHKPLSLALARAFDRLAHPDAFTLSPLPFASLVLLVMLLWAGATAAQSE